MIAFRKHILIFSFLFTQISLAGCNISDDIREGSSPSTEQELVRVAILDNDTASLPITSEGLSEISLSLEDKTKNFDALLISQSVFDEAESNKEIKALIESVANDKVLVVENNISTSILQLSDSSYSARLSFSSPIMAETMTVVRGRMMRGVILSHSSQPSISLSESLPGAVRQIKRLKKKALYDPMPLDNIAFSVIGNACPYGQYLEIAEVSHLKTQLVEPSADEWVIKLSQLTESDSSICGQSDYLLSKIESEVQMKSADSKILDYIPTTGSGDQTLELPNGYSWISGSSDVTVIDEGNTPSLVKWLFNFQNVTDKKDNYQLTQPGLLTYIPINSYLNFERDTRVEFSAKQFLMLNRVQDFQFEWSLSVQSN